MWNILLEIHFDNMDINEFFNYRIVNREFRNIITYLAHRSKVLPHTWKGYMNINGMAELFPQVEKFEDIGHRGHLLDAFYMQKVVKLWLDSPISRFSIVILEFGINNIKHLVVNCGNSCDLLNKISRIVWPELESLSVMIETVSTKDIALSSWKMPKLQHVMFGTSIAVFPMSLLHLPLTNINELSIVSETSQNIPFVYWFVSFMQMWTHLQYSSSIRCIRFDCMIPETELCICSLIRGLNATFIERVFLRPCSISTALKILNSTTVTIVTMTERRSQWMLVKFAYGDRIQLIQSM